MHILIGFVLGAGVLWLWLSGHWFGRVLAFLAFGALFAVIGGGVCYRAAPDGVGLLLGGIAGIALAWPIASLPIWHAERRR